jgi:hypothetical protein
VTRRLSLSMAVAVAVLITAGCSNAGSGTSDNGDNTPPALDEQAVRFAQCMRDNGVTNFPDPDASGALTIDQIANGSHLDTSSAAFTRAFSACKNLEPSGFTGSARTPAQQKAALQFAQCIRDNGVTDFPDPDVTGPLVDTNRIPSAATQAGISRLNAAMRTCANFATNAGVSGPK